MTEPTTESRILPGPHLRLAFEGLKKTLPSSLSAGYEQRPCPAVACEPGRLSILLYELVHAAREALKDQGRLRVALEPFRLADASTAPVPGMTTGEWIALSVTAQGAAQDALLPFLPDRLGRARSLAAKSGGWIGTSSGGPSQRTATAYLPAAMNGGRTRFPGFQRVLLVEDDPDASKLFTWTVQELLPGAEVRVSGDGNEAAQAILEFHPDLVITDLMLPGRSGLELCRFVRRVPLLSATKVLAMTAHDAALPEADAVKSGADGYLRKPFRLDELRRAVASLTSRRTPPPPPGDEGA